jgi:hypothetical protein
MADAGLREPTPEDVVSDLRSTLAWAENIRRNPNHTTTALLLADVVIEQTATLLFLAQEQLDRCNVEAVQ